MAMNKRGQMNPDYNSAGKPNKEMSKRNMNPGMQKNPMQMGQQKNPPKIMNMPGNQQNSKPKFNVPKMNMQKMQPQQQMKSTSEQNMKMQPMEMKKSIFKRWWFWALIVVVLGAVLGVVYFMFF
ncbi:MAG: hypothetical protein ABIH49_02385 [archaeon]